MSKKSTDDKRITHGWHSRRHESSEPHRAARAAWREKKEAKLAAARERQRLADEAARNNQCVIDGRLVNRYKVDGKWVKPTREEAHEKNLFV